MDNGLTTLQFLRRCAFFSLLWIGTIFGIVYSLSNIDATVVMALFACSAVLVYLFSWVLLHQQFVGVRVSSRHISHLSLSLSLLCTNQSLQTASDCCCDNLHHRHSAARLHGQLANARLSANCCRLGSLLCHLQGKRSTRANLTCATSQQFVLLTFKTSPGQPHSIPKVIYQRMFGFWSIAQMSLFFTLIGLFNALLMWPVALLLYFLGVELIVCK